MGLGPEAGRHILGASVRNTGFPESRLCLALSWGLYRVKLHLLSWFRTDSQYSESFNLFQERNWGPASRGVFGLNKSALYEWQLPELREALLASTAWLSVQMSQPGQLPCQDASLGLSLIEHCS